MKYKDKFTSIVFFIIFITYNAIGYIFELDMLKFIILNNNGLKISFISLFVPIILAYLIYYFTNKIQNNKE